MPQNIWINHNNEIYHTYYTAQNTNPYVETPIRDALHTSIISFANSRTWGAIYRNDIYKFFRAIHVGTKTHEFTFEVTKEVFKQTPQEEWSRLFERAENDLYREFEDWI